MTVYECTVANPTVFTQNSYSCCTLNWSQDENGHKTYYDYDDDNRIIDMYTDITGQGTADPLVAYAYDSSATSRRLRPVPMPAPPGRQFTLMTRTIA